MKTLILLAVLPLAAGCTNLPALTRALAKDPAIVSASLMTPYGSLKFCRVGITTNAVTCSPDGTITVKP